MNLDRDLVALTSGGKRRRRAGSGRRRLVGLDEAQLDDLVGRFEPGERAVALAVTVGVHPETLLRHLLSEVWTRGTPLSSANVDRIVERYAAGETCLQMPRDFGMEKDTVRRRMAQRGVETRDGRCVA